MKNLVKKVRYFLEDNIYLQVFLLIVVSAVFVFGTTFLLAEKSCSESSSQMRVNYSYSFWTSCMIEIEPDKWIPLDSYYYKEEK